MQGFEFGGAALGARGLRHEQIDDVLAAAIDHCADGAGIDIIEPAADQRKAFRGEVDHRRRDIELAVEPRLDRVLVGGDDVGEVAGLQRAQMRRDHLGLDALDVVMAQHDRNQAGRGQRRHRRAHRKAAQHRAPALHLARLRQRRLDAPAKLQWRFVACSGFRDRLAHRAIIPQQRCAVRAVGHMVFDVARMAGVEFAVDQRLKQDFGLVAGHFGCSCSASHADRSMARARARRDITVPTGTSATSAISR